MKMNLKYFTTEKPSYGAILATLGLCAVIYLYYAGTGKVQLLSIALFLVVLYLWTETISSFKDFQLKKEKWVLNIVVGVVIGLGMFAIFLVYERLNVSNIRFNASILAAVAVVGAAEEFFFRGYLQGKLSKDFGLVPRIAIVTVLFGLYKFSVFSTMRTPLSLVEIVAISCVGSVILSVQMEKMQNLLSPIVSHVLWDNLVYSNMATVPSWITATPQWTESLYEVLFKFTGFFCSQTAATSYFTAGKQFVTCSGCTGIFLGAFFAFFLFERKFYDKLHKVKIYVPMLLPETLMFAGLNIAEETGIFTVAGMTALQLRALNYTYTIAGIIFGFAGAALMLNVIVRQGKRWDDLVVSWLKDYEYVVVPALLLAFLSNPLTNPQMTALIFFSFLVVFSICTVIVFAFILFVSGFWK